MIEGLFGEKEITKNIQNQIILPSEFREIFEEDSEKRRFFIYIEEERCLIFSNIGELMKDLKKASKKMVDPLHRDSLTIFSKNIVLVNMGGDGRITLTKKMMEKARIKKNDKKVISVGANNKVEIWSAERYKEIKVKENTIEYKSQKKSLEDSIFRTFPLESGPDPNGDGDKEN